MPGLEFIRDLGVVVFVAAIAGWGCRRIGLSPVVGYLLAGLIVGPYTPPASLVTNTERIATLSQLGLVFLMFSIGMQLSLRRLKALGVSLLVATGLGALAVLTMARGMAPALGLDAVQGLFLAGMLVSSSSAIVGKSLLESGRLHSPSGQFAGAITVLEDVVAVVMLALLTSYVNLGGAGGMRLGSTIGEMGAFVALLGVGGLLLVPWLLRRMERGGSEELRTLFIAGLLCLLAFGAQSAGYSLALGAFLLGLVVADTPQRGALERAFSGMRDVFSAVFFVAIGMMIDLRGFSAIVWQVVAVAVFALVARPVACALALIVTGQPPRVAIAGGLSLAPLGEFGFIAAQLGVSAGVLPKEYQPLSVAVALITALVAPFLTARAETIAGVVLRFLPAVVERLLEEYREWLARVRMRRAGNQLWRLSRRRVWQIAVSMLFVSGLLLFAPPLERAVRELAGLDAVLPRVSQLVFWSALTVVVLAVVVAIWRNVSVLTMMLAEATTQGLPNAAVLRPVVGAGLRIAGAAGLFLWLASVLPFHAQRWWLVLATFAAGAVVVGVLWRKLIYWHSEMEVALHETLQESEPAAGEALRARAPRGWDLNVEEMAVPEASPFRGRTIGELALRKKYGCTIAGIDRQGVCIVNPGPAESLFPLDRLLVLGPPDSLRQLRDALQAAGAGEGPTLASLVVGQYEVTHPAWQGVTLEAAAPARATGVQIAGIRRGDTRIMNPTAAEELRVGDGLLAMGTPGQLEAFGRWLERGGAAE